MIDTKVMRKTSNIVGWFLIIPSLFSIAMFIAYPIIYSVIISFTDMRFMPVNVSFVGFSNYKWLFTFSDSAVMEFWSGLWLSFIFTFFSTAIQTVLGFFLAYVLYGMGKRTQGIYKVLMYLPVILPMTAVTVMWKFFLQPEGLVNIILTDIFGMLSPPNWLSTPTLTMGVVIFINTWRFVGITIIIYFVAMNNVDKSVLESARIDGATSAQILGKMLLPLTWSSSKINILLSLIGGIKSYDFFLVLTEGAGNTQVVGMYIYRTAYQYRAFCRAVTMSLFMTFIIGLSTFAVNSLAAKGERV